MSKILKFEDVGGTYSLELNENEIKLECYLLGSPTGGTGTECSHTIGISKLGDFLSAISIKSIDEVPALLSTYSSEEWSEFHKLVMNHQTDNFVWYETDWSDSIHIVVSLSGESRVGSTITAIATATYSGKSLPVEYNWYSNSILDGPYELLETSSLPCYLIAETDQGKYLRVGIRAVDGIGSNSAFTSSKSIGPVVGSSELQTFSANSER